jgi:hypothetical protein
MFSQTGDPVSPERWTVAVQTFMAFLFCVRGQSLSPTCSKRLQEYANAASEDFCSRYVHLRARNKHKAPGNRHSGGTLSPGSHPQPGSFYRSRNHEASPFFKVVRKHFSEFETVYTERYQERYGYRPLILRLSIDQFLKCSGIMKIISFIEGDRETVIEKILRHCGLWKEPQPRPPRSRSRRTCRRLSRHRVGMRRLAECNDHGGWPLICLRFVADCFEI